MTWSSNNTDRHDFLLAVILIYGIWEIVRRLTQRTDVLKITDVKPTGSQETLCTQPGVALGVSFRHPTINNYPNRILTSQSSRIERLTGIQHHLDNGIV